jgi:hypothetical protein
VSHIRLESKKRNAGDKLSGRACEVGTHVMFKPANTIVWVIGRPTWTCQPCGKAMKEAYESALGPNA